MKRFTLVALTALALVPTLAPERALGQVFLPQAQSFGGNRRPTVSPYLNLARGGSPAVNYYGQVLPQLNQSRQLQGQQLQLQQLHQQSLQPGGAVLGAPVDSAAAAGVSVTGHPVAFWNYGRYYPGFTNRGGAPAGFSSATPLTSTPLLNTPLSLPAALTGAGVDPR
jgi:hypothetical protein